MPKGVHVHKLSNVDQEALTADCANCGEAMPIRMKAGKPRCKESIKTYKTSETHKAYMRDYMRKRAQEKPKPIKEPRKLRGHGLTESEAKELREGKSCWICGETAPTLGSSESRSKKILWRGSLLGHPYHGRPLEGRTDPFLRRVRR